MKKMPDELLILTYKKARELDDMDPNFISLLEKELERRGLLFDDDKEPQLYK